MTVIVNGRPAEVAAGETVAGLLAALGHPPGGPGIAVALNGEVVPRGAWATSAPRTFSKSTIRGFASHTVRPAKCST